MADNTILNPGVGGDTIATDDIGGVKHELVKVEFGADGAATMVSPANPLPVTDAASAAALASIAAEDFATQTTLAAVLAKIIASPATEATLAAILAKIIAAPSTEAKQDAILAALALIDAGTAAALGQAAMAASVPVVIASNQSAIPVTVSGSATDNTELYNNTIIATGALAGILTTGYASIIIQLSGVWAATIIVEGSNDNAIWTPLLTSPINEISQDDVINENGLFTVKVNSKYIRLNVLQLASGSIVGLIMGRTVIGSSAADRLSFAMDRANNQPLYVAEIESKKDITNALIPSDAPKPIYGFAQATSAVIFQVDTTGYQSLTVQMVVAGSAVTMQTSNDGVVWYALLGVNINSGAASASVSSIGQYIFPASGRFVRGLMAGASFSSVLVYLRQQPYVPFSTGGLLSNIAAIGGTTVVNAAVAGVLAVGGNIANGVAPTANPILMAGIDNTPVAGLTRRILVDTSGRIITAVTDQANISRPLGALSPAASANNVASIAVQDTSQFEGQTVIEILAQLLKEVKMTNHYLSELPLVLQGKSGVLDEPSILRQDHTLFAI